MIGLLLSLKKNTATLKGKLWNPSLKRWSVALLTFSSNRGDAWNSGYVNRNWCSEFIFGGLFFESSRRVGYFAGCLPTSFLFFFLVFFLGPSSFLSPSRCVRACVCVCVFTENGRWVIWYRESGTADLCPHLRITSLAVSCSCVRSLNSTHRNYARNSLKDTPVDCVLRAESIGVQCIASDNAI